MGWVINLVTNKVVLEEEMDTIINNLPEQFSFPLGNTKQPWGWSTGVDVSQVGTNRIRLSGSYGMSGGIAEAYAIHMKEELNKLGFVVSMSEIR